MMDEISFPNWVLLLISFLRTSPVDYLNRLNLFTMKSAWVPLPAPGGPNIIRFIKLIIFQI